MIDLRKLNQIVKHLPGQHDQTTHGKKGAGAKPGGEGAKDFNSIVDSFRKKFNIQASGGKSPAGREFMLNGDVRTAVGKHLTGEGLAQGVGSTGNLRLAMGRDMQVHVTYFEKKIRQEWLL